MTQIASQGSQSLKPAAESLPSAAEGTMVGNGLGLIFRLARRQWPALAAAAAFAVLAVAFELVPYLAVYRIAVEVFSEAPRPEAMVRLAWLAFGAVVLQFVCIAVSNTVAHAAAFRLLRQVRTELTEKMARLPLGFFDRRESGDLKKALVEDVGSLEGVLAHNIPDIVSGILVPLAAGVALFWVDWRMALASLALLPVGIAAQMWAFRDMDAQYRLWHRTEAAANAGVLEYLRGIAVLKAFNRTAGSLERLRSAVYGVRDVATAMTRRSMYPYALFFIALGSNLLVVLPVGIALHLHGGLGLPQLCLFLVLGAGLTAPLIKLMFVFGSTSRTIMGAGRIQAILDAPPLPEADGPVQPADYGVRFVDVHFSYDGAKSALQQVSFTAQPGRVTALVGPSGAGKSTVARLIARFWDVDAGRVEVGGVDVRALGLEALMGHIGFVFQEVFLLHDSVRENIRLGCAGASDAEVEAAAQAANAHTFIQALPDGYDTQLGDRGARLSGGEKQRLAIARAILKNAPILLLDEATAFADPENELAIQQALAELIQGKTVIVIAHRLASVADADHIVVFNGGTVEDQGTHGELLGRSGTYRRLWAAQQQAVGWTMTTATGEEAHAG
ncbi:ABC transporter ATP-binding protein [Gloeobacter violaceus]|uniref:HlyB/MsbA family ABC transporter n=1 Tax=Gloeobacter violaceus (strain ATCC 29082 / PCC 7421) TaxID=251221 RepID=Q7NNT7_GLOVI|nr:ABC transporter ATP-binding protein [Gloeobacter violaceus]BAC88263.1 HlyB/MsbA family ABC transporter [Gloeobacter violaceus PCC 7421]